MKSVASEHCVGLLFSWVVVYIKIKSWQLAGNAQINIKGE